MEPKTAGQIAYEAYCGATGWKSLITGATLPGWLDLRPDVQAAWEASALAVRELQQRLEQFALVDLPAGPQNVTLFASREKARDEVLRWACDPQHKYYMLEKHHSKELYRFPETLDKTVDGGLMSVGPTEWVAPEVAYEQFQENLPGLNSVYIYKITRRGQ